MKRAFGLTALLALLAPSTSGAQAYGTDFGLSAPIYALSGTIGVEYYGWEGTTVFGHSLWAFSEAEYSSNLGAGCYWWSPSASCTSTQGADLFSKSYGASDSPFLGSPATNSFGATPGDEIIFAIMVDQGDGFNWFFSGDPSRNSDGLAHLAFFDAALYPDGVPGNQGVGVVPQTAGLSLFGFEDVAYSSSDWDFDNLIFAIDQDSIDIPQETVPEPATLLLLGTGLSGLAAARRRRRARAG